MPACIIYKPGAGHSLRLQLVNVASQGHGLELMGRATRAKTAGVLRAHFWQAGNPAWKLCGFKEHFETRPRVVSQLQTALEPKLAA